MFCTASVVGSEITIQRAIFYTDAKQERQSLDVYAPAKAKNAPILVWIHGGGWRIGDKRHVQEKPKAFVDNGFVFVSTNYRLKPDASMPEMAGDIASAIRWVHTHADDFGGDRSAIFVGGHSAGAHLAALVCTDPAYLKAQGLTLSNIRGCVPVDTAMYDAQRQIRERGRRRSRLYRSAFGDDAASQRKFSPISHVKANKDIPPFCILHVASRADATTQSLAFAKALRDAGIGAELVAAERKTHASINREFGLASDEPSQAVFQFLRSRLKEQ